LLGSLVLHLVRPELIGLRELCAVAVYLAYAVLWVGVVKHAIGSDLARQRAALFLDHLVFCTCLALSGRVFAALAWVSVTTSVGHGLRFGQRRGIASAVFGGASIFCAVTFGPLWRLAPELALGMAAIHGTSLWSSSALQRARSAQF
jgi:hypothetical protein